jgi:hypothetical protein
MLISPPISNVGSEYIHEFRGTVLEELTVTQLFKKFPNFM